LAHPLPKSNIFREDKKSGLIKYLSNHPRGISKAAGLVLVLFAALFTVVNKCPSNGQTLTIYVLFGAGLALLFAESAKGTILKLSFNNIGLTVVGGLALTVGLSVFDPIGKYKPDDCRLNAGLTNITVTVHGKKGLNDCVLKGKGKVVMNIPREVKKQPINDECQASFANIPVGVPIKLDIEFSEPYHPVFPDSNYIITPNDNIYLQVVLPGLDKVYGRVIFGDTALAGVDVQLQTSTDTFKTTTNENGFYTISIPEASQKNEYIIWFSKTGFRSTNATAHPQLGLPVSILMEKQTQTKK